MSFCFCFPLRSGFVLGYLTTASRDIVVKNNFFIVFISRSFRRYIRYVPLAYSVCSSNNAGFRG